MNLTMIINRIREKIRNKDYYISSHAEEEMADDCLERKDIEYAIMNGYIEKKLTHDARGTRYRIEGNVIDGRSIHVICRFNISDNLLIITVYALEEK